MPTLSNDGTQYLSLLRTKFHNPSGKFVTPTDELNALNQAAITVANKLGGLWYIDRSLVTVVGQMDYTIPNHIMGIKYLELLDNTQTPPAAEFIDVTSYQMVQRLNYPQASDHRFAYFWAEENLLHIQPAPTVAGHTISLLAWGLPQRLDPTSTALYDGNVDQMAAITTEAASVLYLKTKEIVASQALHQRALGEIEDAAQGNAIRRQTSKIQVARQVPLTRLRRV